MTASARLFSRERVETLVRSALAELGQTRAVDSGGGLVIGPDRGVNLGTPFDADAMRSLLAATPARVAVGRTGTGTRYLTNTLLRFRADHAAAKDAVLSEVDEKLLDKLGLLEVTSRAGDKRIFLERPDAGRALSDEGRALVSQKCQRGPQVQVCYGDGLSAAALNAHLEAFHGAFMTALAKRGIRAGTPIFVRRSRVKVMDEVARLTDAEACTFVCGERPGLGFADSMSAYFIYRPKSGATDADREVISNINPRGLPPAKAAEALGDACARILTNQKSGVVLG
jgi:ethanolamine ammonia-lyase small subunit